MGKNNQNQKTGLGRALVKQQNQMIQQSKEKGRFYKKKFLESFTEVSDIDAIIEQTEHPLPDASPTLLINLSVFSSNTISLIFVFERQIHVTEWNVIIKMSLSFPSISFENMK